MSVSLGNGVDLGNLVTSITDAVTGGSTFSGPNSSLKLPAGTTDLTAGIGGGLPAYLGQVATRSFYNTRKDAGNTQAMLRSFHYARDDISSIQLRWDDKYGGSESASGSPTNIECAVEYPAGTYTRVTFSGVNQGVMASGGSLISDSVVLPVKIPAGAVFWIRTYRTNASGLICAEFAGLNATKGDYVAVGASVSNVVMGGTITTNGFYLSTPSAILSMTTKPSVLIIGDSRALGFHDQWNTNPSGDCGEIARSIGGTFGYISACMVGITAASVWSNGTYRKSLEQYCTHVICNLGINDLSGGASAATVQTSISGVWAGLTKPKYQCTMPPESTSTDSWATIANQTVAAWDANRIAVNAWIRAQGATLAGIFEIADAVESARDSGKWKAPAYTDDGVHEVITGACAIVSAGAINPALIHR